MSDSSCFRHFWRNLAYNCELLFATRPNYVGQYVRVVDTGQIGVVKRLFQSDGVIVHFDVSDEMILYKFWEVDGIPVENL